MNRQYIGARYVVKVYENSQNPLSAEWEQNVNYEALTMVTYNYGTYVSKKPVPANIGNPSENGTYWTQTGFYNGQISSLQNQINNLAESVPTQISNAITPVQNQVNALSTSHMWLEGKKVHVFGDSLSEPKTNGIWEQVQALVPSCTIYNHAVGGEQYSQIATRIAATDLSEADVVFILGGTNNWQGNTALDQFYEYVNSAVSNVYTQNPTCKIVLMTPPYSYSSNFPSSIVPYIKNNAQCNLADYGNVIKFVARANNIPVIDLWKYSGIGPYNYTSLMENSGTGGATIYVHPLAVANEHIASLVIDQCYDSRYIPFAGKLMPFYTTTGITINSGESVLYDPESGAFDMGAIVTFANDATVPEGIPLTCTLPYGFWLIFNNTGRHDEYRFIIMDYTSTTPVVARLEADDTHYDGQIIIEGGHTNGHIYMLSC